MRPYNYSRDLGRRVFPQFSAPCIAAIEGAVYSRD